MIEGLSLILTAGLLLTVVDIVSVGVCASECEDCFENRNHYFMVDPECRNKCVDQKAMPIEGWKQKLYRSIAKNASECDSVKYCNMIGNVTDGSFENGRWIINQNSFEGGSETVTSGMNLAADGQRYVFFGGAIGYPNRSYWQELQMPNERIPTGTTHLSLFIGSQSFLDSTQTVIITVDSTVVLFIDKGMLDQFPPHYQNVDVDVRRFADGNTHSIVLSYFADPPKDGSCFLIDYLRWIKDETLQGNSNSFQWPQYTFCGGGCRTDLLEDNLCHEQCNIVPCNYDNGLCRENRFSDRCYNGLVPSSQPSSNIFSNICEEYFNESCCTNRFDRAFIEERILYFRNLSCFVSNDCIDNIEKAVCAYCSPKNNRFIINGTIQFSKRFQDGLYSSCKDSYYPSNGSCVLIKKLYPNASAFLTLFGMLTKDEIYCFDDLAHNPVSDGVIAAICVVLIVIVVTPLVAIISVICYKSHKNNKESGDDDDNEMKNEKKPSGMTVVVNGVCQNLSLVKSIGKGSFGTVWLAKAGNLMLAAKEMPRKKEEEADYQKEMSIMLQLNSPYVVRMYGSVMNEKSIFILMEYVPLGSLSSALEKYSFSPFMRCRFMYEVSCGMEYLHSQGIIHRDLKPGNVLLSSFDLSSEVLCKLSDFGESRKGSIDTQSQVMTRGVGTPYYMAPEMLRGDEKYTRAVDIYSFGIMCVELWNEQLPYNEVHFDTVLAFAMYVMEGKRPSVRDDCPGPLLGLIRQCWAPDRQQRPSFAAIVQQLDVIVKNVASSTPANTQHLKIREGKETERSNNEMQSLDSRDVEVGNDAPPRNAKDSSLDSLYYAEIPLDDIVV